MTVAGCCTHCYSLNLLSNLRACRCKEKYPVHQVHFACFTCAQAVPEADLGDILWQPFGYRFADVAYP